MTALKNRLASIEADLTKYRSLDELPADMHVLHNFLTLIVDIKYRRRHGGGIERLAEKGYAGTAKVRPDQLTSVDEGLDGYSQRRLPDANK